jgi:uncharacterized membrane protein
MTPEQFIILGFSSGIVAILQWLNKKRGFATMFTFLGGVVLIIYGMFNKGF